MNKKMYVDSNYGVTQDGRQVMLHIDNTALPMPWHIALAMSSYLRVMTRRATEWRELSRQLPEAHPDPDRAAHRSDTRRKLPKIKAFNVYADDADVVLEVGNGKVSFSPEVARNIALWLSNSARELREIIAPNMKMQTSVADLTLAHETENQNQTRRSTTATFK